MLEPLKRDLVKCEDMRLHSQQAVKFLAGRPLSEFLKDDMAQAAVIRCLEVVGEAARQVSEETRLRAPGIPWKLVTGMRHVLAHDYGNVEPARVHSVVTEHLSALVLHLAVLIPLLEKSVGWSDKKN